MRIRSKIVQLEMFSYYSVRLEAGYSPEDYARAVAELEVFRKEYYGIEEASAYPIEFGSSDTGDFLRFAIVNEVTGTDWNSTIFPEAVDVDKFL